LSSTGAVYIGVSGDERIQAYALNMHAVDRDEALARARQELPSDATVAWDLELDRCYRVAFNSPTLEAIHRMAVVQLQELQEGGTLAPNPHRFN
jgi:hypothetical protein